LRYTSGTRLRYTFLAITVTWLTAATVVPSHALFFTKPPKNANVPLDTPQQIRRQLQGPKVVPAVKPRQTPTPIRKMAPTIHKGEVPQAVLAVINSEKGTKPLISPGAPAKPNAGLPPILKGLAIVIAVVGLLGAGAVLLTRFGPKPPASGRKFDAREDYHIADIGVEDPNS